jgi:hypothetical protein
MDSVGFSFYEKELQGLTCSLASNTVVSACHTPNADFLSDALLIVAVEFTV